MTGVLVRCLARRLLPPSRTAGRSRWARRLLTGILWIIALVIQAALILLVQELVQLAHGLASLYLDLSQLQLDLTSQYVTATTPK